MIALAIRQSAAAGPTSNEGRAIVATALCLHEHCLGSTRAVAEQHTLESYFDIVIVAIVGALIALTAVIAIGSIFGSFWTRFEEPDRRLLVGDVYAMCPSGT